MGEPMSDDEIDPPCTDCDDTGITYQTERVCSCLAGLAIEMIDAESGPSPIDRIRSLEARLSAAEAENARLREALGWFLADDRFTVAVGGNPNVVDRMLDDARAALAPPTAREG